MLSSLPRFRSWLIAGVSVLSLSACADVEHMYDRTARSMGDAMDGVFGSDDKPKSSPTKVEVTTPLAAPYVDVEARNAQPVQGAVELGSMSDNGMPPVGASAMPEPIRPVAPQAALAEPIVPTAPSVAAPVAPMMPQSAQPMAAMNAPATTASAQPVMTAPGVVAIPAEQMGSPLMVIRFNQYHVYYDEALAKVVRIAESSKPGAIYSVVSALPDLTSLPQDQQADISKRAIENLRDVATQMQQLGVPASRLKVATQQKQVRAQEISIYVQ